MRVRACAGRGCILSADGGGEAGVPKVLLAFEVDDAVACGWRSNGSEKSLRVAVLGAIGIIIGVAEVVAVTAGIGGLNKVADRIVVIGGSQQVLLLVSKRPTVVTLPRKILV